MVVQTDSLTLKVATTISTERLADLLNQAYADYFIPIWFNGDQLEQMCDDMDVDLTQSVVAMVGEKLVGITLLSQRGREGWVSGVGVIPAWRRRGIGRAMIARVQTIAQALRLDRLRLEVLDANEGGRRLYEAMGFTRSRDLMVLRLSPRWVRRPSRPLRLAHSDPEALLRYQHTYQTVEPSWERALPSLRKRADRVQGLGFWPDRSKTLAGYVLYQAQSDVCHILDLVVDPTHDTHITTARQILLTLHGMYPGLGGYIVNVPAEDPLLAAFTEIGYEVRHCQAEMVWSAPGSWEAPEI
jgi:ribosomal protein S18 acetylase RimI-like enzyme